MVLACCRAFMCCARESPSGAARPPGCSAGAAGLHRGVIARSIISPPAAAVVVAVATGAGAAAGHAACAAPAPPSGAPPEAQQAAVVVVVAVAGPATRIGPGAGTRAQACGTVVVGAARSAPA
eukprot:CAMPEP_0115700556 /NCGR_PEP_ID=MMETSP0272-20121206/67479_1 /TAXON_ID=71861 /ORGANISM="Scrippsiella trochoidea, Strain CCMP3099" /LENGTH=122 /DNA_ID=CAMNT_0003141063 /DNA_START=72 /DNA_END=437 /DNA_ORIENTATION=+